MIRGIVFLVVGLILLGGSLTGRLVMRGTQNTVPITVLGLIALLFGVYRLLIARRSKSVF